MPLPAARLPLPGFALRAGGRGTAGHREHEHDQRTQTVDHDSVATTLRQSPAPRLAGRGIPPARMMSQVNPTTA